MIARKIAPAILESSKKYPVVSVTGPRQSGKTTLVRSLFPDYEYVSLERPDNRARAIEDPNRFLRSLSRGAILDEVQKAPELFSYLQAFVDESGEMGRFILTGSENFLLSERISQSLSGRVRVFTLLPFSYAELKGTQYEPKILDDFLFSGCYPPIYDRQLTPHEWYQDYILTYIERDIRNIHNIGDLAHFQKFLTLCAGRTGQLLNFNSLANETGISHNTAHRWFSLLEASYVAFALRPHHENLGKRVVKQPKLYFYDTGIVCGLLGIQSSQQLASHYLRGAIFESFVISEYRKHRFHAGKRDNSYFWRDRLGHEVDLLIETPEKLFPVEIKSGETISDDFFQGLTYYNQLSQGDPAEATLIYGGNEIQKRKNGGVYGWNKMGEWMGLID